MTSHIYALLTGAFLAVNRITKWITYVTLSELPYPARSGNLWVCRKLNAKCCWESVILKGTHREQEIKTRSAILGKGVQHLTLQNSFVWKTDERQKWLIVSFTSVHSDQNISACQRCSFQITLWLRIKIFVAEQGRLLNRPSFCVCFEIQEVFLKIFSWPLNLEMNQWDKTKDVIFVFHVHFPRIKGIRYTWNNQAWLLFTKTF